MAYKYGMPGQNLRWVCRYCGVRIPLFRDHPTPVCKEGTVEIVRHRLLRQGGGAFLGEAIEYWYSKGCVSSYEKNDKKTVDLSE